MRLLVCGCRDWTDEGAVGNEIWAAADPYREPTVVITGDANGADCAAREWAQELGYELREYKADWTTHGRKAGPIRNQQMLDEGKPDLVLAFWDGKSRGTLDMIMRAVKAGVPVKIVPKGVS